MPPEPNDPNAPNDPPADPPSDPPEPTLEEVLAKVDKLSANNSKLTDQLKAAQKSDAEKAEKLREIEEAREAATREALEKGGKLDELKEFYEGKLTKVGAEKQSEIDGYRSTLVDITTGRAATQLAAEIALPGKAEVLLPHVRDRLATDWKDGIPVTEVLTADGKASNLTLDDLKAEMKADPRFDTLIAGKQSSGGGNKGGEGDVTTTGDKVMKRAEYDKLVDSGRDGHAKAAEFFKNGGRIEG